LFSKESVLKRRFTSIIIASIFTVLTACSSSKQVTRETPLVVASTVTADDNNISTGDLSSLITIVPNKKLLGIVRFRLWIYEHLNGKEKERGEPPALLDSAMLMNNARQMKLYLNNSGYFNSTITPQVTRVKKNKAKVNFYVKAGKPYPYGEIRYAIHDTLVKPYIERDKASSLIRGNAIFNAYTLDDERDRITRMLKNNGFFLFGKNFIRYEADSSGGTGRINITLIIDPFKMNTYQDDSATYPHHQYTINNIYITPDFQPFTTSKAIDTVPVFPKKQVDSNQKPFYFIQSGKPRMHPNTILNAMHFYPGKRYSMEDVKQTQKRMSNLRIYKFANIDFITPLRPEDTLINCRINLIRRPVHTTSVQTEITNSAGNPGVGGNFLYENKNLFRRGEVLRVTLRGALEAQAVSYNEEDKEYTLFNTLELGSNISLMFPKFLFPGKKQLVSDFFTPKTVLSAGYNFQRRPDYSRHISNFSFGYEWKSSNRVSHQLNPLEINSVKIFPDSLFTVRLNQLQNALYKSQYTDHMIVGLSYSFVRSTQSINKARNFSFLKVNVETSGNLLRAYNAFSGGELTEKGYYTLFNIRYAQYVKGEVDYRYYNNLPYDNQMVYRIRAGLGLPYGNSVVMPFEKGFYGGGSNDMRGWKIRTLGPGSFSNDTLYIERIGDMLLEMNIEYRFPIYQWFKGAFFVDAGNIWLLNENEDFPGGKFEFSDFLTELSLSSGLGIRLDFDFFVIRLDAGVPVHDPAGTPGNKWTFNGLGFRDITWNIGIGYPF